MTSPSDPRAPRPTPILRDVAVYNPDMLQKSELVAYFVARGPLLARIIEDLRQGAAAQHHLLIGPRGMGKTTLLKRIRFAIEDDEALSREWLPLTFPEEQYNVSHLSDLYLNCIDALSDALEQRGLRRDARDLDAQIAGIATASDGEDERSRRALALLLGAADAMKKRLVLLLDNVDILLDRLQGQAWALRELLSHEHRLMIVGASASHPEETYTYKAPFYDFFKVHELAGLPEDEARRLLLHLSDLRGTPHVRRLVEQDPARLRTLHTLSGGNPRSLVLLYFVLAQSAEGNALDDLERLLDHLTPLYKARIEALAPQAQKILNAVAIGWHPMSAAEAAAKTQLEVSLVSSQITRLVRDGILERAPTPAGSKLAFQVAERLLNIWYLMRQSRRVRQRLVWLVEFLRLFYGSQELVAHARDHLGRSAPDGESRRMRHVEYQLALAEAVDDKCLRNALESRAMRDVVEDPELRARISKIVDIDGADASLRPVVDKHRSAIELRETVLAARVKKKGWDANTFYQLLGGSCSLSRAEKQRIADSLETLRDSQLDELDRIFREEVEKFTVAFGSSDLVDRLRCAFRGGYMDALDDIDGAEAASLLVNAPLLPLIALLTRLEQRFDGSAVLAALDLSRATGGIAYGWNRIGNELQDRLQRYPEAEAAYRAAIQLDPTSALPWNGLGNLLMNHLHRYTEAAEAYRRAIQLDASLAHTWNGLGNLLQYHLEQYAEAEEAYRKAIQLDPSYADPWHRLGHLLHYHLKRYAEAEVSYRSAIKLDVSDEYSCVALGHLLKNHLQRYPEAEDAYRKAIQINAKNAIYWYHLGFLLAYHLQRNDEAVEAYRMAIKLDPLDGEFWNSFAWHRYLGDMIDDETENAARKAVELLPDDLHAAHTLASILVRRGQWDEPAKLMGRIIEKGSFEFLEKTWSEIVRFFGDVVRAGRAKQAIEWLDSIGFGERWLPVRSALTATIEGRESLLRIAPELRVPAEKIYDELVVRSGISADESRKGSSQKSRRNEGRA